MCRWDTLTCGAPGRQLSVLSHRFTLLSQRGKRGLWVRVFFTPSKSKRKEPAVRGRERRSMPAPQEGLSPGSPPQEDRRAVAVPKAAGLAKVRKPSGLMSVLAWL